MNDLEGRLRGAFEHQADQAPPAHTVLAAVGRAPRNTTRWLAAAAVVAAVVVGATALVDRPESVPLGTQPEATRVIDSGYRPTWVPDGYRETKRVIEDGVVTRIWSAEGLPRPTISVTTTRHEPGFPPLPDGMTRGVYLMAPEAWVLAEVENATDQDTVLQRVRTSLHRDPTPFHVPVEVVAGGPVVERTTLYAGRDGHWAVEARVGGRFQVVYSDVEDPAGVVTWLTVKDPSGSWEATSYVVRRGPDRWVRVISAGTLAASEEELAAVADKLVLDPEPDFGWAP
ncbi:hypothetical protein GCM10022243_08360 [Saccharothrix violaceirubra]|uniref:DUF4367 domain-containing protein n=1 Tax=Saccharothrix violaceirubra TaxID=413306 RepID=A0A7W7SYI5_9PSEU|nr:hypothetical protein [Saccharothrix violaceirubra]MBB4963248.1 hypothetical protein [Saccharothrix violaceirubra]